MATAKIRLDKRRTNSDGTRTICVEVHIFNQKQSFGTGFHCREADFSPTGGANGITWVTAGSGRHLINARLREMLVRAQECVLTLTNERTQPTPQLRATLANAVRGDERTQPTLIATMERFAQLKRGRTRELYLSTASKLRKFTPSDPCLDEISKAWLDQFQAHELRHISQNSVSAHLRHIRATFNHAIDNDLTTSYPFRRFKIRNEKTRHRTLTVAQLRELAAAQCRPYQIIYRDIFLLSFLLIGINPVDLLSLTTADIRNGRVCYRRSKTHKPYSVKIEPEARALMERHRGTRFLLSPLDSSGKYLHWLKYCNTALKKIDGPLGAPVEPQLTMYWARHTWATIAAELDIPKETIAAALGHELGNPVTSVYIDFDRRKIDEANRRVIDYALKKRP